MQINVSKRALESLSREVNQHTVICIPFYELAFQNINTGKTKIVKINGITGKIHALPKS